NLAAILGVADAIMVARGDKRQMVSEGDKILILGGIPAQTPQGTNFIKIHTIGAQRGTESQ
ncbi:MAG TPA: hypothetical protein IGQ16_10280, partial [Thermosynechococcus sp. M3746_W2019_013]|uniref:hypothetical protein n=1 Tax=Thermosynechococcus sp. M3746_W2019_013 TaxID=2747806 RepID=UPI0019EBBD31